jgi:hypothetical protein
MEPVKYYVPEKPVIPVWLSVLIFFAGLILLIPAQDTFSFTFISGYVVTLTVIILGFVLTSLLYKLQTDKPVVTAKYFFTFFGFNTVGIGGLITYLFITINYKKAHDPRIVQLPVVEQYAWHYKGFTNYYVVVEYKEQTATLKVDKLPSPPAKTATVKLAEGYFGYAVVEQYKVDK